MLHRRQFLASSLPCAALALTGAPSWRRSQPPESIGPMDAFIEIDAEALLHNAKAVRELSANRPIMAVVKNDAYGLGLELTGSVLDRSPAISSFGVVKAEEAVRLREAGVKKPILLMGLCSADEGRDLVAHGVQLAVYTDDVVERLRALQQPGPIDVQLYLDTGLGRLGIPTHRAVEWTKTLASSELARIRGSFMTFTEETDFDLVQLERFQQWATDVRAEGVDPGPLHAATSNALFNFQDSYLDQVRPGLALYGAYPTDPTAAERKVKLRCAIRLCAPVIRMEQLRPGDSAGYGRKFIAKKPTWVATIPIGHADGWARKSVDGAKVFLGGATHPIVGAVSASHCLVDCGPNAIARIGDVAVLMGPDHPEVLPNAVAKAIGCSIYDVTMHLSSRLPRRLRGKRDDD